MLRRAPSLTMHTETKIAMPVDAQRNVPDADMEGGFVCVYVCSSTIIIYSQDFLHHLLLQTISHFSCLKKIFVA